MDNNLANTTGLSVVDASSLNVLEKIQEIEMQYKKGTLLFAEKLQEYTREIEGLKHHIESKNKALLAEREQLQRLEHDLVYETRTLSKLQEAFLKHIQSIQELALEYKDLIDKTEYSSILKRKKQALTKIEDEIEGNEASLLALELERLNLLSHLQPKEKEIKDLEQRVKELELEKIHFESTQLQQLTQLPTQNKKENTIVDIELDEEEPSTEPE